MDCRSVRFSEASYWGFCKGFANKDGSERREAVEDRELKVEYGVICKVLLENSKGE